MGDLLIRLRNDDIVAWDYVYKIAFEPVARYILINKGNRDDVKDVFQDAMVVLNNKVNNPDFVLTCKIEVFIYSVARNIWLRRLDGLSRKIANEKLDEKLELIDIDFDYSIFDLEDTEDDLLETVLSVLEEFNNTDCKKILKLYYFNERSHREIADEFNLSENYAKKKKYNCLEYLRKAVNSKLN
jgi:RNA polymerase sigma factor (sigma-70 family)